MQPIEGGLWIVLYASMGFAALVAFQSFSVDREGNIVERAGAWLLLFLGMTPVMFAVLSFFGSLALLAWQIYQYLRFGNWPAWTLAHVLYLLGVKFGQPMTGWVGVDQMVLALLNWSAFLALLLIVPVSALVVVGVTVWLLGTRPVRAAGTAVDWVWRILLES